MKTACPLCGRPKLLDAFGGEGAMGAGYMAAGFCVDTVDLSPARLENYPRRCAGQRIEQGDAVEYILNHGHRYAVRHASPPCTGYSRGTAAIPDRLERYDRLIGATRAALLSFAGPYVIENVEDAKAELLAPLTLCWTEFHRPGSVLDTDGTPLWMRRHRLFESNVALWRAGGCNHPPRKRGAPGWIQCAGAYGGARRDKEEARTIRHGGYVPAADVMRALIGAPWVTEVGARLAVPPSYAHHLGGQLLESVR